MSNTIYEASVYSRKVSYKNFKGETKEMELFFALDPLKLMQVIASFNPRRVKSGNPALNGKVEEISDEAQLKFIRDLASRSAGAPSEDGEYWEEFPNFADSLVGKAFLTKLTASEGDRRDFAEKVILAPFRAFVEFTQADPTNTPSEIQQFQTMLKQLENVFAPPANKDESLEERRARLAAEMAALDASTEGVLGENSI